MQKLTHDLDVQCTQIWIATNEVQKASSLDLNFRTIEEDVNTFSSGSKTPQIRLKKLRDYFTFFTGFYKFSYHYANIFMSTYITFLS